MSEGSNIPATSQEKTSEVDSYGFIRENGFNYQLYSEFESEYKQVTEKRLKRWGKKLKLGKYEHNNTTKRFCRKGIPHELRPQVWMDISGATRKMKAQPGYYQSCLSKPCPDSSVEKELQEAIDTDLGRTFPDNVYFQNDNQEDKKKNLRNVLVAFGRHNPKVCYCQGMNYLAALLLLVVKDEEKSFWLLCALIDDILPSFYLNRMAALRVDIEVFADLVRSRYPDVEETFKSTDSTWMLVASKWFICLFIDVLPIETVLRIWDCVFYEQSKILFRVALAIVLEKSSAINKCQTLPDVMEVFRQIRSDDVTLKCHLFMKKCFSIKLKRQEISELREKHHRVIEADDENYRRRRAN